MIAHKLDDRLLYNGKSYKLNLMFDNVLRIFELQKDRLFSDTEKIAITVEMLVGIKVKRLTTPQQLELFKIVFDNFIFSKGKESTGPRILDFSQDSPYIYASFMQAYKIDLQSEQGKLDWRKFIALFQGLPENTKIKEIMNIRARKLPKPDKYNSEEIRRIQEAKTFYAIEISEDEAEAAFQRGINKLVTALEHRAKE